MKFTVEISDKDADKFGNDTYTILEEIGDAMIEVCIAKKITLTGPGGEVVTRRPR